MMSHVSWPCHGLSSGGIHEISAHQKQTQAVLILGTPHSLGVSKCKAQGNNFVNCFCDTQHLWHEEMKKMRQGMYHGKKKRKRHFQKWILDKKFVSSHALYVDNKFLLPISPTPKKKFFVFVQMTLFILSTTYQVAQE